MSDDPIRNLADAVGHPTEFRTTSQRRSTKSRGVYIILGLMFGFWGFHDFYAGHYARGVWPLVVTGISLFLSPFTDGATVLIVVVVELLVCLELITENRDGEGLVMR